MRNYVDPWQNIIDIHGKYLVGRLTFLEPNTSGRKLTIYDTDGNELDNPIYTSTFGLPKHQIMLLDQDYKVTYEMYIGQGNMESDENEENWLLYKTVLSVNGNLTTEHDSQTPTFVNTLDELKQIGGQQNGDTAILKGYYEVGDSGEPRLYVWHEAGNWTDDGGVVIKSNNTTTGAWVMSIPGTYIDVRWYGDIPDTSANPTTQTSNLGQRSRAASAANRYDKDLYFPARQTTTSTISCYIFDGSNTISVDQNIICDSSVRFIVKHNTSGTAVNCKSLIKPSKQLFAAESQSVQIGGYTLTADWINTSWLSSNDATARNARVGYVIDQLKSPLLFENTKIKVERDGINMSCTFKNCEMVECYKQITGSVTMQNMNIHTDWFADDYNYSDLTLLIPCTVKLANCKDADTYILLKNKIQDFIYGDLGEQELHNATVRAGCVIENCYGSITVGGNGNVELHNASLTINNLRSVNSLNVVDSWLTIPSNTTVQNIQFRRGALQGNVTVKVIGNSFFENVDIYTTINCLGTATTFSRCDIRGYVQGTNITIHDNNIYNQIDQRDADGVINVNCIGNMFYNTAQGIPARHYIHATTANSIVSGMWLKNGSSYDTIHWIRLDRTNLQVQDGAHNYTYAGNSEPYLMKWSGRNHPMKFYCYGGHWSNSQQGTGVFATTTVPFCFFNSRDRKIYAVPRQRYWKMFTVGRGFLMRSGRLMIPGKYIGIMEGDYNDHDNGQVAPVWNWGCQDYYTTAVFNNQTFGCMHAVSRDGNGEADYICSFESENADHTGSYSYGTQIGNYPSKQWDDSKWQNEWPVYPATPSSLTMFVFIDPDFSSNNNPQLFT